MSKNSTHISYCIEIELQNKNVYITDNKVNLLLDSLEYISSRMEISEIKSNDFGQNNIIIKGFYDKNLSYEDISNKMNFTIFSVVNSDSTKVIQMGKYVCEKVKKDNLYYSAELKCKTHILEKAFLPVYSKKCRAEFGDFQCKKNIDNYSKSYRILKIDSNLINLDNILEENQYYKNGYAIIEKSEKYFKSKIISHAASKIMLDSAVPHFFIDSENLNLVAGCNKKATTCCNKFNNIINFRGEPFVEDSVKSIYKFINSIKNER